MIRPSRPKPALLASAFVVAVSAGGAGVFSPALAGFDRAEIAPAPEAAQEATSGWCEVRLSALGSATLKLEGREATLSTPKGSSCRIHSVACSAGMGDGASEFLLKRLDGLGRVELLWPPTRHNGWDATIRLYDAGPGDENYSVRLEWRRDPPEDEAPGQGGSGGKAFDHEEAVSWKRLSYDGPGRGSYRLAGSPRAAIESARWVASGDGEITGSFALEGGGSLEFVGHVASSIRSQMVASIQSPDGSARRGSMTIGRNRDGELKRIAIEGIEDGRSFSISFAR